MPYADMTFNLSRRRVPWWAAPQSLGPSEGVRLPVESLGLPWVSFRRLSRAADSTVVGETHVDGGHVLFSGGSSVDCRQAVTRE